MLTGKKVRLIANLRINHPAVRLHDGQSVAHAMIHAGSEGLVVESQTSDVLVEFNQNGAGHTDKVWIRREFFSQLFDTLYDIL
jgi:hypothetical protein